MPVEPAENAEPADTLEISRENSPKETILQVPEGLCDSAEVLAGESDAPQTNAQCATENRELSEETKGNIPADESADPKLVVEPEAKVEPKYPDVFQPSTQAAL